MGGADAALSPIYAIASEFVDQYAALDPVAATAIGVAGRDTEMSDYSPEGHAKLSDLYHETLLSLEETPVLGERDRIARDALAEALNLRLDVYEAGEYRRNLSIIGAPSVRIRRSIELLPRATEHDWHTVVARLRLVPIGLGSFERTLEEGLRRGETAARRQVLQNVRQAETWAGQREGLPSAFESLVDAFSHAGISSPGLSFDVRTGVAGATSAFASFARFLRERYLDAATERDGVGRERYELGSRASNGTVLDLDETYAWGWDELQRIEAVKARTADRILPGQDAVAVTEFLDNDQARCIDGVDAHRRWLQEIHDTALAELNGVHFDIPEAIRRVEVMIPPPGGALAASYTGPSEDFSRPGRTWWPVAEGQTRFPKWHAVSTAYHEGVPGHHLQIATAKHLAAELSRFQRLMGGTSGYVEGWALYAERLMAELGYLDNPDYYFGMLCAQALRAARVIVDIGLHLELRIPEGELFHGGGTWTADLAQEFLRTRGHVSAAMAESEIVRYLGTPGQAISYKVGERSWLQARQASKDRHGAGFDLKEWHAQALNLGPMGLAQMQRELAAL